MSKRNNRLGETHGNFEVIGFAGVNKNGTIWECLCKNCGAIVTRENRYFRKDRQTPSSCRYCCRGKYSPLYKGHEQISGTYLARAKKQAKDRGYCFKVKPEELWDQFEKQNKRCYITGVLLSFETGNHTASLDRIDNTKGYTKDNIAWCHKVINRMKMDMELSEFIYYCKLVKEPQVKEISNGYSSRTSSPSSS